MQVYGVPLKNSVEKLIFLIMQIEVFKFKEQEVRTKIINGKEYFCASDVCKILDIQNGRDVVASLENGCVVKNDIPHPQVLDYASKIITKIYDVKNDIEKELYLYENKVKR